MPSRMLCAQYWRSGEVTLNFGETFMDLLGNALDVEIVDRHPRAKDCWLIIGSELHRQRLDELLGKFERVIVWGQGNGRGAGMAFDVHDEPYKSRVVVRGVRGPMTISQCRMPWDTPYGDPGFLLPRFYPLERDDRASEDREIIYVPHWHNAERASHTRIRRRIGATAYMSPGVRRDTALAAMTRLYNAKMVLTNAMHVWVFCQAYHVPHVLMVDHDEYWNMPMKWKDLWLSLGQEGMIVPVSNYWEAERFWNETGQDILCPDMTGMLRMAPGTDDVGLFAKYEEPIEEGKK